MNYKKQATFKEYTIGIRENKSVEILVNGKPYDGVVKKLLMEIASQVGVAVEKDWNTQYMGHIVVKHINSMGKEGEKSEDQPKGELKNFRVEITTNCYYTQFYPIDYDFGDMSTWDDWEAYRETYNEEHFNILDLIPISDRLGLPAEIKVYDEDDNVVFEKEGYENLIYNKAVQIYPDPSDNYDEWDEGDWNDYVADHPDFWKYIKDKNKFLTDLRKRFAQETCDFKDGSSYYCCAEMMRNNTKTFCVKDTEFDINKMYFLFVFSKGLGAVCEEILENEEVTSVDYAVYNGEIVEYPDTDIYGIGAGCEVYEVNCDGGFIEVSEKVELGW